MPTLTDLTRKFISTYSELQIPFVLFTTKFHLSRNTLQGVVYQIRTAGKIVILFKRKRMNKFLGFFKEKVNEVKQENKKDLSTLVKAVSDESAYKSEVLLEHLQKIKANYMTWNIMIANEASTGLYYSQVHNRNVCLRNLGANTQKEASVEKYQIVLQQMKKTREQLREIGNLGEGWVHRVSSRIDHLASSQIETHALTEPESPVSPLKSTNQGEEKLGIEEQSIEDHFDKD